MKTKNSINWSTKQELSWMGNLIAKAGSMTRIQLLVECEKHYKGKISKSSLENQITRLKNLTYLQEIDGKLSYPQEINEISEFINELTEEDIKGSQSDAAKEDKQWMRSSSLKKILDAWYLLKEKHFSENFDHLSDRFKKIHGKNLSVSEINKFNQVSYPILGYMPFTISKKGVILFDTTDDNVINFPNQVMTLINSRTKTPSDHLSNHVIYDEGKLLKDEINFGLMVREGNGFGVPFEQIISGWEPRYGQKMEKEYISYMSKDLINKAPGNFICLNKKYYIKDFQKFIKSVDPSRLHIDIVLVTNQSIPKEFNIMNSYEISNGEVIYSITAQNDEKLHKFLRRLVARKNGKILYPSSLSKKLDKELEKVIEEYVESNSSIIL